MISRGTIRIVDECKKAGMPEPEFREEFGGLSVRFRKEAQSGNSGKFKGQVAPEVKKLLSVIEGEMTRKELQKKLGLKDEKYFRESYQQAGVATGLIEMTIPDKPNSLQPKLLQPVFPDFRLPWHGVVGAKNFLPFFTKPAGFSLPSSFPLSALSCKLLPLQ